MKLCQLPKLGFGRLIHPMRSVALRAECSTAIRTCDCSSRRLANWPIARRRKRGQPFSSAPSSRRWDRTSFASRLLVDPNGQPPQLAVFNRVHHATRSPARCLHQSVQSKSCNKSRSLGCRISSRTTSPFRESRRFRSGKQDFQEFAFQLVVARHRSAAPGDQSAVSPAGGRHSLTGRRAHVRLAAKLARTAARTCASCTCRPR